MLILTRSIGDEIRIGPDIVVKILDVQGKNVQLGIEAPKDVKVARPEAAGRPGTPPAKK